MTHRQRVINVLSKRPVDKPAIQCLYNKVGFYEHGEALNDLFEQYPGDFCPFHRQPIPVVPPSAFDANGQYYEQITDEWGTTWEYRVYGIMGHAINFPIKTPADAAAYTLPPAPSFIANVEAYKRDLVEYKKDYFAFGYSGRFLECLWAIRGFEDLMMDLADPSPEILGLMDRLAARNRAMVEAHVSAGAEGIDIGDDFGTQTGLVMSKDTFRNIIKPRLAHILEPARRAGLHIHLHTCGQVSELFGDFKDLGIKSIWPQLPLFDMRELKREMDY